jgi:cytochrome c oxidase subunit II
LADTQQDLLQRPLPDGIVPAAEVARTEKRWLTVMVAMLIVMMAVVVLTGVTNAIHPPSNVETIDPTTLHLSVANLPKAISAPRESRTDR